MLKAMNVQEEMRRRQYLDALGITRWEPRHAPDLTVAEAVIEPVLSRAPSNATNTQEWTKLEAEVRACVKCTLHATRMQTVFGVGMKMTIEDEEDIDSAFQMRIVDFEGCKKRAYFPYEVLVDGNNVEALHMRFRMALHFPNLSMMGKHGFTKLMSAPGATEKALEKMVNAH